MAVAFHFRAATPRSSPTFVTGRVQTPVALTGRAGRFGLGGGAVVAHPASRSSPATLAIERINIIGGGSTSGNERLGGKSGLKLADRLV
jgi:hypothetical protein